MTDYGSTKNKTGKSAFWEYMILVLIILAGTPVAIWWGHKDGKNLAARAFEDSAASNGKNPGAVVGDSDKADDSEEGGKGAPASSPEAVARGAANFQVICASCHGINADGKGPAAVAFTPPPRNFTDPAAKWTRGREPAQIHTTVSKGIEGTGMAGFAAAMKADELWDIVHYLGSLPGVTAATSGK